MQHIKRNEMCHCHNHTAFIFIHLFIVITITCGHLLQNISRFVTHNIFSSFAAAAFLGKRLLPPSAHHARPNQQNCRAGKTQVENGQFRRHGRRFHIQISAHGEGETTSLE
jgi:hypothetical protein